MSNVSLDDLINEPLKFAEIIEKDGLISPPEGLSEKIINEAENERKTYFFTCFRVALAAALAVALALSGTFEKFCKISEEGSQKAIEYCRTSNKKIDEIINKERL